MSHLTSLLNTCETVWKATGGKETQAGEGDEPQDNFTKLRKEIAADLKDIRKVCFVVISLLMSQGITARDKMLNIGQDARTAEASHKIRLQVRSCFAFVDHLDT